MSNPRVTADALIEVDKVRWAAEGLRDSTEFLADFEALSEPIPVVKSSVNDLIAGPDRTLADLFDFTGKTLSVCPAACGCSLSAEHRNSLFLVKRLGQRLRRESNR